MTKYRLTEAAVSYFGVKDDQVLNIRKNQDAEQSNFYPFKGDIGEVKDMLLAAHEVEVVEYEPHVAAEIERLLQVIDQKNAALTLAGFTFGFYADSHMKKETDESTMKAFTNIALRRAMLDAIEIN